MTYFRWILLLALLIQVLVSPPISKSQEDTVIIYNSVDWSPNSNQLLLSISQVDSEDSAIWIADVEMGNVKLIVDNVGFRETQATWSPNGNFIAYRSRSLADENAFFDLWVMDLEHDIARNLTTTIDLSIDGYEWSPDSQSIAFSSGSLAFFTDKYVPYTINVVNIETEDYLQISSDDNLSYIFPHWSADGKQIAFLSVDFETYNLDESTIWLTDFSQPNNFYKVAEGQFVNFDWSPNDEYIAAEMQEELSQYILLISVDTKNIQNLTSEISEFSASPSWSPDSQWLAFTVREPSEIDNLIDLEANAHLFNVNTLQLINISKDIMDSFDQEAYWSHDGQTLAILSLEENRLLYLYDMETRDTQLLTLNFTE